MNKDYYPTPSALAHRMKSKIEGDIKTLLEPSAGKGDLVNIFYDNRIQIDAIEIEPELQEILKSKKINLVHDDFLTFDTFKKYDVIFANFPFSDGDKHLLKAIQIQERHGGQIVCLVNANTIKNTFSKSRNLLEQKLADYNAYIEFLENEFSDAERKTDVEVALVSFTIPEQNSSSLILENLKKAKQQEYGNFIQHEIVEGADMVDRLVSIYKREAEIGTELIKEYYKVKELLKDRHGNALIKVEIENVYDSDTLSQAVNGFMRVLRQKYWGAFIYSDDVRAKYTENVRAELEGKMSQLIELDFSHYNLKEVLAQLSQGIEKSIDVAIQKLFDELSFQHSYNNSDYEKNIHYFNGWKTNKAHKINEKVILPMNGYGGFSWTKDELDIHYIYGRLSDIIKTMQYLDGKVNDFDLSKTLQLVKGNIALHKKIKLPYITVSFFKKGTCHIYFEDKKLLDKLNIIGAMSRNWLPPSYGKKKYQDMSQEEKEIINDFQGEQKYNEVLLDQKYYLQNEKLLLT